MNNQQEIMALAFELIASLVRQSTLQGGDVFRPLQLSSLLEAAAKELRK